MTDKARNKAFLSIVLAAIGVLLLAAGLPDLRLTDGLPFPGAGSGLAPQPVSTAQNNLLRIDSISFWMQGLLALGLLLLLVRFVFLIVVPQSRAWIRPVLIALAVVFALVILAASLQPMQGEAPAIAPERITTAPSSTFITSPLGSPPAWLLWLIAASLVLLAGSLGFWLFRQAFLRKPTTSPLVQEAQSALAAIQAGTELSGVIVRCYLRMNQAVLEERGMARGEYLTPREFERYLAARGVPDEPLRALTRLFEMVRYGRKPVDEQAEQTAVACLTAIIQYCEAGAAV